MKLLYDLIPSQPEKSSKFHGGSEYCKTIFRKLVLQESNVDVEVVINPLKEVDSELIQLCNEKNIKINKCTSVEELGNLINKYEYDKFYSALPYEYNKLKINSNTKFIFTIHGLRGIEMLGDKYEGKFERKDLKYFFRKIAIALFPKKLVEHRKKISRELFNVTKNKTILAASYHTKYSILNHFSEIDEDEVKVLYSPEKLINAIDFSGESEVLKKNNLTKKKYILLVSGDRWLKNNYRAVKALDKLFSQNRKFLQDIKVIILGVDNKDIYFNTISNKEKFIIKGYKNVGELEILYKNAHLLLYPTLNEGFGYPPFEAMKYGTYVAVSAISSITEVCGDSVLYFNPYDINEINNRVMESFDDEIMREKSEKIKSQYRNISLKQHKALDDIVQVILQQNNRKKLM